MRAPRRKWTAEEEEALRAGLKKHGEGNWKTIREHSHCLAGRSNDEIRGHYDWYSRRKEIMKKQRTGGTGRLWTSEEEEALKAGVNKYGTGKWRDIQQDPKFGQCLAARSNIDLKDKWRNMLNGPEYGHCLAACSDIGLLINESVPKTKWTAEEEDALKAGVNKYGKGKWKDIKKDPEFSQCLAARSNIDLKDKWRCMLRPKVPKTQAHIGAVNSIIEEGLKKRAWTATEDRILSEYIKTHGQGDWSNLPTKAGLKRSANSCKKRWFGYLLIIGGSNDHCKEIDLQSGNGFLGCPLGGRNVLQTYEMDCNNGENCCFSEFCQLSSLCGEKTDDNLSLSSDDSLFLDEMLQNWPEDDVPSDIESLVNALGSDEARRTILGTNCLM